MKIWFKAKRYGWGWVPASWEGWLVLLAYIVGIIYFFRLVDSHSHSNSDTLIGFSLPFIILSIILIIICRIKGEPPRWRWGGK